MKFINHFPEVKMKRFIIIISLIVAITAIFAIKFDPDYFVSKSIIVCFTKTAIGNDTGKIDFTKNEGVVQTGISSFDKLALEYRIVDMQQMHPYVKDPTWNDNGLYLQNTYRLTLASDDNIDEAVEALSNDKNLIYAELEGIVRSKFVPNDPLITQQYVHDVIRSYDAWDYIQGSHNVKVAITDSGVKWNHPDLRGNIWINPAEAPGMTINWDAGTISGGDGIDAGEGGNKIDDLVGWDFYANDNNPIQNYAGNYHGTHVAGCAGAVGNNAIGVVGTSPIVSLIICKGAPDSSPSQGISFAYDQVKYAGEVGADIINASWGSVGNGAYPNSIVNYVTNLGALVVTAAGNENTEHNSSYQDYPADCTNAFCVASTGRNDIKSSFSDYGATIDICAPGENILSTIIANNGYESNSGTSMASPIVAGVCALVKALNPELTPQQLMQRVMHTADYIYDKNPDYVGMLGAGRVNAFAATMYDKIPYITIEDYSLEEIQGDGDGIPNPGETIKLKVSLNNYIDPYTGLAWLDAQNLSVTLSTTYPGVTIIENTANYGTIIAGSTMWNNNQPFIFQTVATLPSEPIPFELTVTANQSADYPYNRVLPLNIPLTLNQVGWPLNFSGASTSSPIIYNLDSNSDKEIVVSEPTGIVHILKPDGRTELEGFPLNLGSAIIGSLAMGDVNYDGTLEFAACLQNNNIVLFNQHGTILWSVPSGGILRNGPVIASLAMDDSQQIIALTQTGNIVVLNPDGSAYPNFPVSAQGICLGIPAIGDLNGDGHHEIIVATMTGNLNAINSTNAQNIPGFPVSMQGGSQNPITIANLDDDNYPEIIVTTTATGNVLAYNHDGTLLFQKNLGGQIKTGAVVADVDNNGIIEIIVITASGNINVLTPSGADYPNTPLSINQTVECTPVVARFDGDNYAGIIFGDSDGYLHSVRVDGTESPNFPIPIGGNIKVSAALTDIDRDGDIDIVIPNDESIYVIDVKRPAQSYEWYCYLGTWNRSGNIYQATPNNDYTVPQLVTTLYGNYPNPFNPETTIRFELATPGLVTLDIYNQKGQLVKNLVNTEYPTGFHQITWNGTDQKGSLVSSGIYYYHMRSGKFSATRKMILMK